MNSIWNDTVRLPTFERLTRSIKADVLIIGGGMAGILCAYMLKNAGVNYVLAESHRIGGGVTKNTTAKITFQHGLSYDSLQRRFGSEKTQMYLRANAKALEKFRTMCADIDCGFEEKDAYVYTLKNPGKIEAEIKALEKNGYRAEFSNCDSLPFPVAGAIKFRRQAQFNPLMFLGNVARGLNIYENTSVRELAGTTAFTDSGKIKANKIIVATHFPFINKHGSYYLKMFQHRSYVVALKGAPDVDGMYVDEAQGGLSFRNFEDFLLLGGGGHRTGKNGEGWNALESFAHNSYPSAHIKYRWAAQDCMTLDGVPYIGRYSALSDNLYVATGFNKWGMTSSMASAMILCDMVLGKKNPYAPVFSPQRTIVRPQLFVNGFEAVKGLLTLGAPRCPHLGCALKYNRQEHSWDCSCHGSRFKENGKLIDDPATGDMKNKKRR